MKIQEVVAGDLPGILALQKEAYLSEAELLGDYSIPPLMQTLEELEQEFHGGVILKANKDCKVRGENCLVGSVRGHERDGTVYIGKLMVHPSCQNQGVGKSLLQALESHYPGLRYELFTSDKSLKNLSLYVKSGYEVFKRQSAGKGLMLVFLHKNTA